MKTLTIRRPDDWHVHLRDGAMLEAVLPFTARQFNRAIVMPNLVPPVTTTEMAAAYRKRIMTHVPEGMRFTPLMTAYLTDGTDPADLERGHGDGIFTAAKLYPAHATTNSAHGVHDILALGPVLETMQRIGMPLLIHGEVTDPSVDIFDREAVFIERTLSKLTARYPGLRIVLEHATTGEAVAFVEATPNVAATITAHHLVINRNAIFQGGLQPHAYCLPVAKREAHRLALRKAATGGSDKFFLGTDTAPHPTHAKERACGCAAGIFTAPNALEVYVEVFEQEDALGKFEAFASLNGPRFYSLPVNEGSITLEKAEWTVPETIAVPGTQDMIRPFRAGETMSWRLVEQAA
jgi:dihydroorotase